MNYQKLIEIDNGLLMTANIANENVLSEHRLSLPGSPEKNDSKSHTLRSDRLQIH